MVEGVMRSSIEVGLFTLVELSLKPDFLPLTLCSLWQFCDLWPPQKWRWWELSSVVQRK